MKNDMQTIGSNPVGLKGQFAGIIMNLIHTNQYKKIIQRHIIDKIDTTNHLSILDVGCGGGKVISLFSSMLKCFKHAIFCLKTDLTTHVFIGTPTEAKEWRKYDKDINLLFSEQLNNDSLEWKIYKDLVLYKGKMLPPKEIPEEPYWGEVVRVETFNNNINDQWIVSKIKELYNK